MEHGHCFCGLDDASVLVGEAHPTLRDVDAAGEFVGELLAAEEFEGDLEVAAVVDEGAHGGLVVMGHVHVMGLEVDLVADLGLRLLPEAVRVIDIKKEGGTGGVEVFTAGGEKFRGRKCVVTVGAWAKKLVKAVSGVELPIEPLETHVCYWRVKEGQEGKFAIGSGFPTFASFQKDIYVYGTPTLEFPGLIKVGVHGGEPCDPDKRPWGAAVMMEKLKEWVEFTFKGMVESTEPVIKQSCIYSMTPDEDFLIDFLGGDFGKDVVLGAGFSGHGFKMAPVIGRILTDLAVHGETKSHDISYFRIARFRITSMI